MNNVIKRKWCTKGTVYIEGLTGTAFTGEDGGHTFIISGVNPDGTSVTLAGTVAGTYILPDGSTQPLTGSIVDGKAQITLDPECYALPGRGQLTIFLMASGQKVAIYGAVLNVARSSTDQVPPAITADVADLVNDIEEARATIPASYTNLMASLAKNYADLTYPVAAGTYAWQDGWMYRAKVDIPSAESWKASHWGKVPLADSLVDELSALKSALNDIAVKSEIVTVWAQGYINNSTGNRGSDPNSCVSDYIVSNGFEHIIAVGNGYKTKVALYSSTKAFIEIISPISAGNKSVRVDKSNFIRVQVTSESNLSPSSITDSIINIAEQTYTDKTLAKENIPADAKSTGAMFEQVSSDLTRAETFDKSISSGNSVFNFLPVYQAGSLNNSGDEINAANRYRTDFLEIAQKNFIVDNIPSDVYVYVYTYDQEKAFLSVSSTAIATRTVNTSKPHYIRIVYIPTDASQTLLLDSCKKVTISLPSVGIDNTNMLAVPLEGGKYSSGVTSYSVSDYNNNRRSAYFIKTNGAKGFLFDDVVNYTSNPSVYVTVYCYSSSFEYIGYVESNMSRSTYIELKANTEYIKFSFPTNQKVEQIIVSALEPEKSPELIKNVYVTRTDPYEFLTFKVDDESCATARLMLPPNYTPTGQKVPLILWLDGSGNFAVWGGGFTTAKLPYLYYLRDEGFAILSIFGWSSTMYARFPNCGRAYPYPVPTCIKCLETGLEYVFDRYNIDSSNVHIMSKSQGGQCGLYFASNPIVPGLRSIGMFSPVLDYLSMPGEAMYADTRKAIAYDLGFAGDTEYFGSDEFLSYSDEARAFFATNLNALIGMNEAWTALVGSTASERLTEAIDDSKAFWTEALWRNPDRTDYYDSTDRAKIAKIPVKIWGASDDANTPYRKMVEIVEQLKNGGSEAVLETLPSGSGDHSCADAGSNIVDSVTTSLGITHTDVPVGWVENVEWIRLHMSK